METDLERMLSGSSDIPPRILISDDEKSIIDVIRRCLENDGVRVDGVTHGDEAVRLVRENEYDVVLTDIVMPGQDGLAVLKAAKEKDPETEVILMTGYAAVQTAASAVREGASDYLCKPFENLQVIQMAVRKALTKRMFMRMIREYNQSLTAANHELKFERETMRNFAEVVELFVVRTTATLERIGRETADVVPEEVHQDLATIRKDVEELRDVVAGACPPPGKEGTAG